MKGHAMENNDNTKNNPFYLNPKIVYNNPYLDKLKVKAKKSNSVIGQRINPLPEKASNLFTPSSNISNLTNLTKLSNQTNLIKNIVKKDIGGNKFSNINYTNMPVNLNISKTHGRNIINTDDKFTNINIIVNNNYIKSINENQAQLNCRNESNTNTNRFQVKKFACNYKANVITQNSQNKNVYYGASNMMNTSQRLNNLNLQQKQNEVKSSRSSSNNVGAQTNLKINLLKMKNNSASGSLKNLKSRNTSFNNNNKGNNSNNSNNSRNNSFSPINIKRAISKQNSVCQSKQSTVVNKESNCNCNSNSNSNNIANYDTTKLLGYIPERYSVSPNTNQTKASPFIQNSYSQLSKKLKMSNPNSSRNSLHTTIKKNQVYFYTKNMNSPDKEEKNLNTSTNNQVDYSASNLKIQFKSDLASVVKASLKSGFSNNTNLTHSKIPESMRLDEEKVFSPIKLVKTGNTVNISNRQRKSSLNSIRLVKSINGNLKELGIGVGEKRDNSVISLRHSVQSVVEGPEELHFMHVDLNIKQKQFVYKLEDLGDMDKLFDVELSF